MVNLDKMEYKWNLNDAVTPQCQSQFTPKMKANAEPNLWCELISTMIVME